jgi:D-alanine-D-alanine ligase
VKTLQSKNIGVLMGGLSPEREISLLTGNAVLGAIRKLGLTAKGIDVDRNIAATLKEKQIDLAFIALHGTYGEDGTIQGLLEYAGIPYTGAGVLGSALAYNKVKSKEVFKVNSIPTADYQVAYRKQRDCFRRNLDLPLVVKPSDQGSSLGISIVMDEKKWKPALDLAFEYSEEVLIEEFVEGRLVAVGMNGEEPMPVVHIRPRSGFYDYEAKYTQGKTEYRCPADLGASEAAQLNDVARAVFRALGARGVPRIDAIIDGAGVPKVLEMNTIPGMTPTSLLPMAAKEAGMDFETLTLEILKKAARDYED